MYDCNRCDRFKNNIEEDEDVKESWFIVKTIIGFIIALILLICLSSCRTITVEKEVPIEKIKTEYINKISYDSIYIHDSINVYSKGDTVFKDKIKLVYRDKWRTDTIHKTDSIDRPVYITKEVKVEKKLNWFQQTFIYSGILFWLISIVYIIYKKLKNKLL